MWSTLKKRSGSRLGHDKRDIPAFDTVSLHSNLGSPRRNYLSIITTDIKVLNFGSTALKRLWKYATGGSKIKKEKLISGSLRGNFWQPLFSPEARKERSCQSFSASHMEPRADCPFHRPDYFRPGPGFESRSGHYLDLFLGSLEFKSSATLVNSQLVCRQPVGIFDNVAFNLKYLF